MPGRAKSCSVLANLSSSICRAGHQRRASGRSHRRQYGGAFLSRRAYIIGIKSGATNVFFSTPPQAVMAALDISVARDVSVIRTAIRTHSGADVNVEAVGDGILLSGTVASQARAASLRHCIAFCGGRATASSAMAAAVPGSGASSLSIGAGVASGRRRRQLGQNHQRSAVCERDQIMLKVTVAEVERDVVKQLGINLSGSLGYGTNVVNFNNTNPFSAWPVAHGVQYIAGSMKSVTATLQASTGPASSIRWPSRARLPSPERSTFMAEQEFPSSEWVSPARPPRWASLVDLSTGNRLQEIRRQPGLRLSCSPRAASVSRYDEVSDLSTNNSLTIPDSGTTHQRRCMPIRTCRADTTVEIPSGGALAMAGMIQDETKHVVNGLPGLITSSGPLFKSNDAMCTQRAPSYAILVTPYVVRAVATKDLSKPGRWLCRP